MFINRLLLSGKKLIVGDNVITIRGRLPPKLFYNQFRSKKGKLKLIELDEKEIREGSEFFAHAKKVIISCRPIFLNRPISYRQFAAASRAGGQKMNRKATAVELRYAPTGTIVWCQDKRTPEQNYELALLNLRKAPENPL